MITFTVAVGAAAIAFWVARRVGKSDDLTGRLLIGTIVFLLIAGVTRGVVLRPILAERARMEIPIYRALKSSEPALYESIKSGAGDSDGTNTTALSLRVRDHTAMLLAKYGPRASDEAVRNFIAASLKSMEAIASLRGDAPAKNIDPAQLQTKLLEETVQGQLAALGEVIRTGSEGRPVKTDRARAEQLLEVASSQVISYSVGSKVDSLRYTIGLYRQVLSYPPDDSALVIRYMLEKANPAQ